MLRPMTVLTGIEYDFVVVTAAANTTCLLVSDRDPRSSSLQKTRCMPVVIRNFEHHIDDGTIWLDSAPILRENTL
ncbi:hypothetical protein TNCV_4497471 [Trichonephila clavipes]|nr:hypothetical protein TNCV_4497471 [Trichonephila clavipes]